MFGQKPKLPLRLQTGKQNTKSHSEFVMQLEKKLSWVHELARVTQNHEMICHKNGMIRGCNAPTYNPETSQ